jgi:hypothetical protein
MGQPDRMMHDKATILAIIKYFLITAVVLLLIYLAFASLPSCSPSFSDHPGPAGHRDRHLRQEPGL